MSDCVKCLKHRSGSEANFLVEPHFDFIVRKSAVSSVTGHDQHRDLCLRRRMHILCPQVDGQKMLNSAGRAVRTGQSIKMSWDEGDL